MALKGIEAVRCLRAIKPPFAPLGLQDLKPLA